MKRLVLPILVAFFSVFTNAQTPDSLVLIRNGKSNYVIHISDSPSMEELRAAEFLKSHLKKMTGCDLPIQTASLVGEKHSIKISKNKEIALADAYRLYTEGRHLKIEGGTGKGCIYGVSTFLENLGVQYYSPTYVVIPEQSVLKIPRMDFMGSSPNTYRNVHGRFAENQDYRDFHKLHVIEDMFAEGYYVHTFHRLIPWQTYFKEYPEFFAFMNGKRIIDQVCPSHPEVLRIMVNKLRDEMKLQPDKQVWSVSQDDNFSYCTCERCSEIMEAEGSPAGPIIHLVNAIADTFPQKTISTLAYQYSRKAPALVKPRPNVHIMLCSIELNRSQAIETDPRSVSFLRDLEDWGKISDNIYLWDYTVDFAHSISPFPNYHVLQPNIQLFVKNKVRAHFQQSNTGAGHEFSELKSWLLAKLLWNPDAQLDTLVRDFTEGYYGPAGVWVRKYIYHLQDEINKTGEWLDIYGPPNNHAQTFLSEENIRAYRQYFTEGKKAVANQGEYLQHLSAAEMPLQYAIMEIGKNDMFGPRGWYSEKEGMFKHNEEMLQTLENFFQNGKEIQSEPVNESGLSVEAYYQSTKRFIQMQVQGNKAFRKPISAHPSPSSKYGKGDLSLLSNGVRGANDFKVHWLGWEAQHFSLLLDLEHILKVDRIAISTLWDPKSWILHPAKITCLVSPDGNEFELLASITVVGDQRTAEVNRQFDFFNGGKNIRFIKFEVEGTLRLFDWHSSAGGGSWVFVDEIVVR